MSGPRWRVAVVRFDSVRTCRLVDDIASQLRAAGCMAVEIDTTADDPFVDIDSRWSPAVEADAYDLVLSVDRLLPAAVAIAALAGVPVATLTRPPVPSLPSAIEEAVTTRKVRALPVLEVIADHVRGVSMNSVDVHADPHGQVVAEIGQGRHTRPLPDTSWSISPIPGPTGQLVIAAHATNTVHQTDQIQLRAAPQALHVELDDRSRTAGHVYIRGIPQGLRVLDLCTAAA